MSDKTESGANSGTIEDKTKHDIAAFLPDAIAQALTSYYRFSQQSAPEEAKEFSAHHNACKVAIAHIELLIKLARWADLPNPKDVDQNQQVMLAAMMEQAKAELDRYNESHTSDTDKEQG